ncbi:adenylate/guanylate cyclase domain-containing protein [Reyranella sp.]|uniref:adenylate/guanylate cyclase domain-containing protein n=1 Tax=Reyranella sp. TaxID=1929291 RepID=UPI003D1447FB
MASALLAAALPEFEMRSRAVMVADVVGYSRLMEADELATHARLSALRVNLCDPLIVSHRGEMVKNTGDGFIALFEVPSDAVQCAAQLQRELAAHEAALPSERRILFRMGLHWEPVILEEHEVYGAGVNIAVRLQGVAPAGGVLLSAALVDALDDRKDMRLEDLGELRLKNLSRPVRAFSLYFPGMVKGAPTTRPAISAAVPSIAVLPFANLSAEPHGRYFAEGFVEDIIVTLSNLPELLVVSRDAALTLQPEGANLIGISGKLGVRYLLTGNIRRQSGRLRISVELVDVAEAAVMWAESYDAALEDMFDVQDEIAIKIVGKIANYVRRSEIRKVARKPPTNLNAYDCLLQGLDHLYRLDFPSFSQARTFLERACEEDPNYAAPYAFLAHWHMFNVAEGWSTDSGADTSEVMSQSQRAIDRDPFNGLALAIQGHAHGMFYRDYDTALDLFDRAIAASPNNSWVWVFSSGTYGFIGDPATGIARAQRATRLAPLGYQAFFNLCLLAQNHYLNGDLEDAIRWARKSLSLNPRLGNTVRVLAASLTAVGRHDEARRIAEYHTRLLPTFRVSEYAKRCPFNEPNASRYVELLSAAGIQR